MLDVHVENIVKHYPNGISALDGITLGVLAGQCLALVGPSGCGKTTLLRIVAGLEEPTSGTVRFAGRVVNELLAHRRDVAMVFQRPALIPGKTVRDNLVWGWSAGRPHDLTEVAELLGIGELLDRRAEELS